MMPSKNNYDVFNTSIEDYSIDELYNLLELEELSREHIILKVHDLNANMFKNNEPIKVFFLQAQDKLLNHLSNSDSELDYYLHNNANNNIESNLQENFTNNIDADDPDPDADHEADANANTNTNTNDNKLIETYVNYSNGDNSTNANSTNANSTNANSTNANSTNDNLNRVDSANVETYYIHKNL